MNKQNSFSKISHLYSGIGLLFFLLIAFGSMDDNKTSSTSSEAEKSVKKEIPKMTEDEYCNYFQIQWDSVKLLKRDGFPQYSTYCDELNSVLQNMVSVIEQDTSRNIDLGTYPSKLNKIILKFIASKKNKDAIKNWLTYGQPLSEYELKIACKTFLKENAHDPSSIDIEDYKIDGQSKNGWVVIVKYRGKNAFGGLVLNVSTFDVRYNPIDKFYYAVSAY